jgi:hypothetical protein
MYGPHGQANLLTRATTAAAALFMVTSISLAWYSNERTSSGSQIDDALERVSKGRKKSSITGATLKLDGEGAPSEAPAALPEGLPDRAPAAPPPAGSGDGPESGAAPAAGAPAAPAPGAPDAPAGGSAPVGGAPPPAADPTAAPPAAPPPTP